MFIHSVYFWLRQGLTSLEEQQFDAGVRSLREIEGVRGGYIGVPAATDRPVIERGYSRALVLVFEDEAGHDGYQEHPVHDRFRRDCARFWTEVRIFDVVTG